MIGAAAFVSAKCWTASPACHSLKQDFENPALQTILRLPTADRIQAARVILKSLDQPEDAPLSSEMIAFLDAQLEDFRRNPNAGEDWETVRASIESRL